jgi:polyhydroxybutyrate depolymerase
MRLDNPPQLLAACPVRPILSAPTMPRPEVRYCGGGIGGMRLPHVPSGLSADPVLQARRDPNRGEQRRQGLAQVEPEGGRITYPIATQRRSRRYPSCREPDQAPEEVIVRRPASGPGPPICVAGCLLLAFAALACRTAGAPSALGALEEHHLQHGGIERSYWLAVPPQGEVPSPAPLVLALHGGGGRAASMCRMRGGLLELARQGAFLLVCPQGVERHWNDGRQVTRWRAQAEGIDDVGFLAAVIEDVAGRYPVDRQRVFVTGISNGGLMSYRLACERADLVSAIAPVAASMVKGLECAPSRPVSVVILNGTTDPLVPYGGGSIGFGGDNLGRVIPTDEALRRWAALNRCVGEPAEARLPDRSPADGTRLQLLSHTQCAGGSRVVLYRIEGGGHTWPGGPQYLPVWLVGRVSDELDGGRVIWDFFEAQPVDDGA